MSTKEPEAFVCHWIAPVLPVRVIVVELPEQTVPAVAVAVPPTEPAPIFTVAVVEFEAEQPPLVTTALKPVVEVNAGVV